MSPKSLLRHKLAVSTLEQISEGGFQPLIEEIDDINPKKVTRLILCSGKVYFDLLEARRKAGFEHIAIFRVEQLYPFPMEQLTTALSRFTKLKDLIWCQEEPQNQGAWHQIKHRFLDLLGSKLKLDYAGRPMSAAPAVGSFKKHVESQTGLVKAALEGN